MVEEIRNIKSGKRELRQFGIMIVIILLAVSGFLFWKGKDVFELFLLVSVFLMVLGLITPVFLKPFYITWMIIGVFLGFFMTRVILIFIFYGIITPLALMAKLFGKQFLSLKYDNTKVSYWNCRKTKQTAKKEEYIKQF